jgi:hypothetical protein
MNPLQRAAFNRKLYYLGAILALFTISMFWRGILPIPLSTAQASQSSGAVQRTATRLNNLNILNQSRSLDLRELEQGEPEIEAEGLRLLLLGSRGFAVTALWYNAIEKQKRNDFHKMEVLIRQVTQLQPHFISPWIFQSWNVAYNVSVEMHGSGDMYHYIARGIELLAEGERRNSHVYQDRKIGSPDMRYWVAFYYQNKFGVSDQVEVLRCLFQLSCIPPDERNPDSLIDQATRTVDLAKFREFCIKHPHLVRRLRGENQSTAARSDEASKKRALEALKCPLPENIVQFLRDNRDIPTRYKSATELAAPERQFPVLPPRFNEGPNEAYPGMVTDDGFSAYKAARAWYAYSMVPIPPNPLDSNDKPLPSPTPKAGEYNPLLFRVPRQPMLIIFRQGAPRVQTAQAEMEQKEGWFDDEGWRIDDPREPKAWFPGSAPVIVGKERPWSLQEWQQAAEMWDKHGYEYGLVVEEDRLRNYQKEASTVPSNVTPWDVNMEKIEDPDTRKRYQAAIGVHFYGMNRSVTNFPYFLASSKAEARKETVIARKTLWHAEQARKLGDTPQAIRLYHDGLEMWKKVLLENSRFHRPESSDSTEEQTYGYELAYIRLLVQDDAGIRAEASRVANAAAAVIPFVPTSFSTTTPLWNKELQDEIKWSIAEKRSPFHGAMDVNDERKGGPWIRESVKRSVRMSQGTQQASQQRPQEQAQSK